MKSTVRTGRGVSLNPEDWVRLDALASGLGGSRSDAVRLLLRAHGSAETRMAEAREIRVSLEKVNSQVAALSGAVAGLKRTGIPNDMLEALRQIGKELAEIKSSQLAQTRVLKLLAGEKQ